MVHYRQDHLDSTARIVQLEATVAQLVALVPAPAPEPEPVVEPEDDLEEEPEEEEPILSDNEEEHHFDEEPEEYCSRDDVQKLESELLNHKMVGSTLMVTLQEPMSWQHYATDGGASVEKG